MSFTQHIFDSFVLNRMLTEFSWDAQFEPNNHKTGIDLYSDITVIFFLTQNSF